MTTKKLQRGGEFDLQNQYMGTGAESEVLEQ